MATKILSIAPTWEEVLEKIRKQGYVYIKTPTKISGEYWIHKEEVSSNRFNLKVIFYPEIILDQKYYGITFALTKEELK